MNIAIEPSTLSSRQGYYLARFNPYRIPPHLVLHEDEEVIDGEIIYDLDLVDRSSDLPHLRSWVDERRAIGGTDPDPSVPEDVEGPDPERPEGVRVQWKRPTELIAEAGAYVSGRGIDFVAEKFERFRAHVGLDNPEQPVQEPKNLPPMDPFGMASRHETPAPPETLTRS